MDFHEDVAFAAYQDAIREMEAFRPTYDRTQALEPLTESGQTPAPKPGDAETRRRWLDLVAKVEQAKAELNRVRGD